MSLFAFYHWLSKYITQIYTPLYEKLWTESVNTKQVISVQNLVNKMECCEYNYSFIIGTSSTKRVIPINFKFTIILELTISWGVLQGSILGPILFFTKTSSSSCASLRSRCVLYCAGAGWQIYVGRADHASPASLPGPIACAIR